MLVGVFPPSIGGIQTHTLQLARRVVSQGANVHVVTRHHESLPRYECVDGVHVHRVGDGTLPRGIRVGSYLAGALARLRVLRNDVHVLHAHELLAPAFVGCLARAMLRKPLVLNPHSPTELSHLAASVTGRLQLAAIRRCGDAFVSICQPITRELLRVGIDRDRLHRISNGVDSGRFRPTTPFDRREVRHELGLSPGPTVVYLGRLSNVKGVDVLLDAWPWLEERAHLCIVGEGEDEPGLRRRAERLRGVTFVGAQRDPLPFLRAADVAVLPSRSEGMSVALLEAMSCGLTTVASAVGGTPELIEDGKNGLLVPPGNPGALAAALIRALDNPSMGPAARARIVERHSIDWVATQMISLYQALVGQGAPARTYADLNSMPWMP